jgi:YD repeat-containing protein
VINLEYDRLGRLVYKKYGEVINSTYLYDGLDENGNPDGEDHGPCTGRITKVIYPGGYESYTYDHRGRITAVTKSISGRVRTLRLTYDEASRLKTETLPFYYRLCFITTSLFPKAE